LITWSDGVGVGCISKAPPLPTPSIVYASQQTKAVTTSVSVVKDGLAIDFMATRAGGAFTGYRTTDGVRFLTPGQAGTTPEDRFAFVVRPNGSPRDARPFIVYVNFKGHCFVDGPEFFDTDRALCHGAVRPKGDKNVGGKDDELAGTCQAVADDSTFCGRVVAQWALLSQRLRVGAIWQPYAQSVDICTAYSDRDLATSEPPASSCTQGVQIAQASGERARGTFQADDGTQSGNSGSAVDGAASSARARAVRAAGAAPAASPKPKTSAGGLYGGTAVIPIVPNAVRASFSVDKLDVGSILARLQQNASASGAASALLQTASQSALSLASKPLSVGCEGKCPDDSFKTLDAGIFDVLPTPFRKGVGAKFADAQVDLKPVDFSTITSVNYGAKLVMAPLDTRVGLAWYRDIDAGASGSAIHADHDFGPFALGVTHVVANTDPAQVTNPYQIDTAHTANTVVGAIARLSPDRSVQLYGRYGFLGNNTGARDMLSVLTYAPTDVNYTVNKAGSYWRPFAGVGYRAVDAGYDPLGTQYDSFTGTKSIFATAGYQRVAAGVSNKDPQVELSLTGVRSWDDVQARYNALAASFSMKLGAGTASPIVSLVHTRSNIATSVFARQSGVLVTDADEGRTLLRNDSDSATVKLNSGVFTFSAGPAWTNAPKKCDATATPKCAASPNRQLSYELLADQKAFYLDVKAGLAPATQTAFDQKAVASNQLDVKAIGTYSNWCFPSVRVQPSATFDTNVAENRSSYVPGKLFEARLDFGGRPTFEPVLRFSYKVVNDQSNPVPAASLSTHAFFVGVTIDGASRKFAVQCKADPKTKLAPRTVAAHDAP
jgi:hypothetical protein